MITVQLYTPGGTGWSSQPLDLRALPGEGHWIWLADRQLKVRAVVHTGWDIQVYASPDDFGVVLDDTDEDDG